MGTIVLRHKVSDFASWKQQYDEHTDARAAAGFVDERVLEIVDDPNDVVVIFEYQDLRKAREFTSSPDLKAAMEAAGVIEEPTIYLAREATD